MHLAYCQLKTRRLIISLMKKSIFIFLFPFLMFGLCLNAQHTIGVTNNVFTPNALTINVGETVTWDNTEGFHNVNGSQQSYPDNPESFGNGAAAMAPWMFSHTFNVPGSYTYHCDPHFSVGMVGTINVVSAAADDIVITEINYNNPNADDFEYVELFNNSGGAIDLEGWTLSDAVSFTFPASTIMPGQYVVVANNAAAFDAAFGFLPFQFTGALNNTGEDVVLSDALGAQVDIVGYSDSAPWPGAADGFGPSLSLCDVNADNNDPANWLASISPTGVSVGGVEILATPGAANECPAGPIIDFLIDGFPSAENAGNIFIRVVLSNGNANETQVTLELNSGSTATMGDDYILALPITVTFDAGTTDTQTVQLNLIDDTDIEPTEQIIINLTNPTNSGTVSPNGGQFTLNIIDNDTPITNAMVISGVFDAHPANAGTKGIELKALVDIADISTFGVGSANNGTGPGMEETPFPPISLMAGDCIYVVDDSAKFISFFGPADVIIVGDAANINGDDAIELFENSMVTDVFGDVNMDGSGEPWDHLDGWAYRVSGTGPDGNDFKLNNWTFSGVGALLNVPNNASAPTPFPVCSYSDVMPSMPIANDDNAFADFNTAVTINILGNDQTPNALTSMTVTSGPDNGITLVNGLNDITYTPNQDFCGTDGFIYEICDMNGCGTAFVTITVACPATYPPYDIAVVTKVNAAGQIDSLGVTCQLQGIVHGIDLQGNDNIQFTLIDGTGGISLFSGNNFGYTVTEGDELIVRGTIEDFNCLGQIAPDTLILISTGNALATPEITTFLDEDHESELVKLTNLSFVDVNEWLGDGNSFNVQVTNGVFTNTMRIDNDTEMASMPAPQEPFHATGIGGQFDNDGMCDGGYQFLPRYWDDIEELDAVFDPTLAEKIHFYPNPVSDRLVIETDLNLANVQITNMLGQVVVSQLEPSNSLDVSSLGRGIYLITFQVDERIWTDKLVKE